MIPYTAKIVVPVELTDAMLVDCSVPEPAADEVLWDATKAYSIGDVAIRTTTHKKYKRLVAGTTATPPEQDMTEPPVWLDIGATNRWAQFDKKIGTKTLGTNSVKTTLRVNSAEAIVLLECQGASVLVVKYDREVSDPLASVVYMQSVDLDGLEVTSIYDWMYGDPIQKLNVVLYDLPGQYATGDIEVTVTGSGTVGWGTLVVGRLHGLGSVGYGAGAGIINWGKVTDDGFGGREWLQGDWSSRVSLPITANAWDFPRIHRLLASQRSTPCVYIGSDCYNMEPLVVYGVYKDSYITVQDYSSINYNLEIEGLSNA